MALELAVVATYRMYHALHAWRGARRRDMHGRQRRNRSILQESGQDNLLAGGT